MKEQQRPMQESSKQERHAGRELFQTSKSCSHLEIRYSMYAAFFSPFFSFFELRVFHLAIQLCSQIVFPLYLILLRLCVHFVLILLLAVFLFCSNNRDSKQHVATRCVVDRQKENKERKERVDTEGSMIYLPSSDYFHQELEYGVK